MNEHDKVNEGGSMAIEEDPGHDYDEKSSITPGGDGYIDNGFTGG